MTDKYFKRGYACKKCISEHKKPRHTTPLYTRIQGVFKFSGLVLCPWHGATEAVNLMDVA